MSPSSTHEPAWDNSGDILQGIMASRMAPSASQFDPVSSDGVTPSDLALGDPASFLGFQFGPEPTLIPHNHTSILNQWPSYHSQASSPTSQVLEYPQFRHPRLTNDQDAWNPLQVTGVPTNPPAFPMAPHPGKPQPLGGLDRRYSIGQHSTPSENGSQYNSIHPSDSGYSSRSCATRSVTTPSYVMESACSPYLGPHESEQDDRASTLDLNPVVDPAEHVDMSSLLYHDVIRCDYPGCQWTGKCPSDKRKHEARHRKLFKCNEPNCTRKEGFGTINDLARHKKCVHKQEPERGPKVLYMCFGQNCPRRNKKWPRLDNFRQHLARMHNDEDTEELLKKSHDWYENCVKPQEMAHISAEGTIPTKTEPVPVLGSLLQPAEDLTTSPPAHVTLQISENQTQSLAEQSISHFNRLPPHTASQHLELPLKALDLNSTNHDPLTATQSGLSKNDRMDEMVNEAATNMINAMTKMINSNQRRRSHVTEDGEDIEENVELTGQKKEMLQRILSAALERLSGDPAPAQTSTQNASDSNADKRGWIQCEFCSKRTRLRCEMKKHQKRHERPYGCTFDRCNKTFGSKADWKRHENSQHFHLQSWRCTMQDVTQGRMPCARLFYRQEVYVQHLKKHHQADDGVVREALYKNRMGRNGQSRFWCGFCRDIVPLKTQGIDAWNERFNHIDAEHFKRGERIGDWLLPSGHLTKSAEREEEMRRALANGVTGDDGGPDVEYNSDDDSTSSVHHSDSEVYPDEVVSLDAESVLSSRKRKVGLGPCAEHDAAGVKRYKAEPFSNMLNPTLSDAQPMQGGW
ncbi:predicted protein [Aspergillus terreus NIH2624]|uniref:C2H2-type domain-containing protein n=1 Tax=Aspergillus terreus (strain NIH 2624 / FGSC A1156) TaxID=341663 RepID=Q0D1Z3_ASPTN|nr:uncharacterized protein ATEG_00041 [Aspergillus terreus NIH2624]EAU38687.1 predicted protein [Aspergillus terreus NIH2624]